MATQPDIQIDRNVPLPTHRRGRPARYPFAQMKVGDSFLHPGPKSAASATACAFNARHRAGFKFAYREEDGGTRIWRRV